MDWLLFLPQLPASPSTLRVTVWRRMRAAGALGLQNGVWVIPATPETRQFIKGQMAYIKEQGAGSYNFEVQSFDPEVEETVLADFRKERDEEYTEFCERCEAFLAEIKKETTDEKFTFAELEEAEADLHKLETWLGKITTRDVIGGNLKQHALDMLEHCREAAKQFTTSVYTKQGVDPSR